MQRAVHAHSFEKEHGFGGAPRNYADVWRLIEQSNRLRATGHDIFKIISSSPGPIGSAGDDDVVLSNAGPYAHFYHYMRERTGRNYRIVRDARTAFWAPYLLQEVLCAPLLREGDLLILPSCYAAAVYAHLFPHLCNKSITIAYPLNYGFVPRYSGEPPASRREDKRITPVTIGYLGRLSEDKNFPEIADLLSRIDDSTYSSIIAGPQYPKSRRCRSALEGLLRNRRSAIYLGPIGRTQLTNFFSQIDVLLFPCASSNETFGRVLAEASYAGVPVIGANFGPARDLIPSVNLLPVKFKRITKRSMYSPFSFGWIDESSLIHKLQSAVSVPGDPSLQPQYQEAAFIDLLHENHSPVAAIDFSTHAEFLGRVHVENLTFPSRTETMHLIRRQMQSLQCIQRDFFNRILCVMRIKTPLFRDAMLRRVAMERLLQTESVGVLRTSILGCADLGFDPRLTLLMRDSDPL